MVVALVGSRSFNDYYEFCMFINTICKKNKIKITHIVTGDARGTDSLAIQYAIDNNITFYVYKANWKALGKAAGIIRNNDIITNCQCCIAFWDGMSPGTKNDIELCKKQNKRCFIYQINKTN